MSFLSTHSADRVALFGRVEALGYLEDVLASSETLKSLGDLLGRVEGLGLLEDVLAASETLERLG